MTGRDILDVPMQTNDAGAETIRGYFVALLRKHWREGHKFDGKRPFGNSSWKYEMYKALAHAHVIEAEFDDEGYLETCDYDAADRMIADAIETLGQPA